MNPQKTGNREECDKYVRITGRTDDVTARIHSPATDQLVIHARLSRAGGKSGLTLARHCTGGVSELHDARRGRAPKLPDGKI